jgi:D-galactose 1-dehydrogenase
MPHRIAIIGVGKITQDQHLPVIARQTAFDLAAVVSQRGIEVPGVPTFRTPAEMYRQVGKLDAVAICTPPSVRHRIAKEALAAGKHVLLEKPPTPTSSELFDLAADAKRRRLVMFTTWHSQYNAAVAEAKRRLTKCDIRSLDIQWREDVRHWHPGQNWVWLPGGFGVFDPGINALSILTKVMPEPIFLASAHLSYPENRDTPIAASLAFKLASGREADLQAEFDWRQTGEQIWDITIVLADGRVLKLMKAVRSLKSTVRLSPKYRPRNMRQSTNASTSFCAEVRATSIPLPSHLSATPSCSANASRSRRSMSEPEHTG